MSRENVEAVLRGYAAFNRGDLDAAIEGFHPEIEWHGPGVFPDEDVYRGVEGVRRFWGEFLSTWESYKVEPLSFHDAGDQVAVVVHISGRTHDLEVGETRSSLLTVRDGRIARVQSFADPEGAREALGLP